MLNLAAARRFHEREGYLNVPRKHAELVPVEEAGRVAIGAVSGGVPLAMGMFLAQHPAACRRTHPTTPGRPRSPRHASRHAAHSTEHSPSWLPGSA